MRAAIYARMSTDKQSSDSPADQIARCRAFATSRGWNRRGFADRHGRGHQRRLTP